MKRVISLFVVCIILMSNISIFAASDSNDSYNEKLYSDVCDLINALDAGVTISENSIDTNITRIDLLRNAVKILNDGIDLDYKQGILAVTDVSDEDIPYLEYAARGGLISYNDKFFYPDRKADLDFAKNTLIALVSFYVNTKDKNASLANELMDGLRSSAFSDFKAGDAYVMIYNLLLSDRTYMRFDGSTIMEGLYHLIKGRVRIVGDSDSSYTGTACDDGRIKAEFGDGQVVDFSYDGDTKNVLGRYVYIWYNAKENDIVFMTLVSTSDIVAEFDEQTFIEFDNDSRRIYWNEYRSSSRWETTYKERNEAIPQTADIIFNGVFISDYSYVYDILENHTCNIDKIQLINTGRTSGIDLVKIDAYTTAYVSTVNESEHTIRDKNNNSIITLDPEDNVGSYDIEDTNGDPIGFSNIPVNSIVSIFDIDGTEKRISIISSSTAVEGTVSTISEENGRIYVTADGIEYQLSNSIAEYAGNIVTGTGYVLRLDHKGLVSGFEIGNLGKENVGGVISMTFNESPQRYFSFSIYTIKGEVKEFVTRDRFNVNGARATLNDDLSITVMTEEDQYETMSIIAFKNYVSRGLLQYKLDGDGNIRDIIIPKKDAKQGVLGYSKGMNNPDIALSSPNDARLRYKTNSSLWFPDESGRECMNFVAVNSDTLVINIPPIGINNDRENYYSLGTIGGFRNDEMATVVGYSFNSENSVEADILAVVQNSSTNPDDSDYYVVKKKVEAVNNNEDIGYLLKCVNANTGSEEEFTTESKQFAEYSTSSKELTGNYIDIDTGDIIKVGLNGYGDAASFILTYDCSSGTVVESNASNWYAAQRVVLGCIYSVSDSHFTYVNRGSITGEGDIDGQLQIGACKTVITVDFNERKDGIVRSSTPSSLVGYKEDPGNYSKIIYITRYGDPRAVIEYKQ